MNSGSAIGISAVLGVAIMGLLSSAVGWSQSLMWLGTLGGGASEAYAISADGRVVVGASNNRAFRWTAETGMQDIGALPGAAITKALGVSADGRVVVGVSNNRAFRWTADGGMQDLGALIEGGWSEAYAVSADGRVVVGWSENARQTRSAFRWTADTEVCHFEQA